MEKIVLVYTGWEEAPIVFAEKDRIVANAYLKAMAINQGATLYTIPLETLTLEDIAQLSGKPLALVQRWSEIDEEALARERVIARKKAELANLERQIERIKETYVD